jgi:hypothetical protein
MTQASPLVKPCVVMPRAWVEPRPVVLQEGRVELAHDPLVASSNIAELSRIPPVSSLVYTRTGRSTGV